MENVDNKKQEQKLNTIELTDNELLSVGIAYATMVSIIALNQALPDSISFLYEVGKLLGICGPQFTNIVSKKETKKLMDRLAKILEAKGLAYLIQSSSVDQVQEKIDAFVKATSVNPSQAN